MPSISDQLREAIRRSPLTLNELSTRAGISQGVFTKFLNGSHVTTKTVDRLAALLKLNLTSGRPKLGPRAKKKKGPGRPRKHTRKAKGKVAR